MQIISEVHPDSYPLDTGVLSPGVKHSQGVTLTAHPHLVPGLRIRSYTSSPPWRLHCVAGELYFIDTNIALYIFHCLKYDY
jgi:hypothetical protein